MTTHLGATYGFSSRMALAIFLASVALAWPLCAAKPQATPADKQSKSRFLRVERDAHDRTISLQTAIVRFAAAPPKRPTVTVDLIGAVHIGDKAYYERLNREFRNYDAVLFELVTAKGTKIPKGEKKSNNPLSAVQRGMKDVLELEFQLDQIDYTKKNMVHADMSPEEFARSMRDHDESVADIFARALGYALAKQGQAGNEASAGQLLAALFDKNRALALKRVMAEQFQDMDDSLLVLEGPNGSTLVRHRNEKALEVLKQQIAAGKRKIAIFYGAAHLTDMEKRLRADFGLVPTQTRWITAWDMRESKTGRPKAK